MWGIVPAAGAGSRIQPLAFSKELLPVGSRQQDGRERPRAVSEYLLDRMVDAGARKICFVISPGKSDIVEYFGGAYREASLCYVVQPSPTGLCDALFRALPLIGEDEHALIGLPDTIWFPEQGLRALPPVDLSFLLFPVQNPEVFDAVITDAHGQVKRIDVKQPRPGSNWVWGAVRVSGRCFAGLHTLWTERARADEYLGTLVNAYIEVGGTAVGIHAGESYVDVGTLHGYREAMRLLFRYDTDRPLPMAVLMEPLNF